MINHPGTGGPAFPQHIVDTGKGSGLVTSDDLGNGGLTLRDYFAAKAMTMKFGATGTSSDLSHHAKICYEMADAMLEARK